MDEWGEFYNEPSEFEQQVDEFKKSLLKSVKSEYTAEMEQLRKENAELQEVKNNFDKIKNEFRAKERQLECDRSALERSVRRARLGELIDDVKVLLYRATYDRKTQPKCDKCDEHRRVFYTKPSGQEDHEMCACNRGLPYYKPEELIMITFGIQDGKAKAWYDAKKAYEESEYVRYNSEVPRYLYETGTKFEDLDDPYYYTWFESLEDCQKYCDWLTVKGANQC